MDYLSISWNLFLENKWIPLHGIALAKSLNNSFNVVSELIDIPIEVLIAIVFPFRNPEDTFRQMSLGLDDTFVTLGKPNLKVAYKVKLITQSLKVAVMNWGDNQECGLLTWTGTNEDDITFINSSEVFEKLSDFHNYCHGRQQQMESLNREATENAIQLQIALADMDDVLTAPTDSSIFLSEIDPLQEDTNSTLDHSSEAIGDLSAHAQDLDFKLIKSSRSRDKLSYCGYIYNFQRATKAKQQWRCQVKNCKGRIHTTATTVIKLMGQHCHGEEIGKEEVLEFRARVKRRALGSHDNPHRIIAEASGQLSNIAKTLLPREKGFKKICQRIRPAPTNPTTLFDLHFDENIQTLGGNNFLAYDSGPGLDRIVMFSTEENKKILSYSTIWMADGTFKVVPSLFVQLYTVHALVGGTYPFRDGHLLPSIYILLPGKSSSYYRKMWHIIQQLCPGSNPQFLLVDFEKAAINTFAEVWPRANIKGCFFHLSQSVYRKVQDLGLKTIYSNDTEFSINVRMLPALAYLPSQFVLKAFETLKSQLPPEALGVYNYFRDIYVGEIDEFGVYHPPLFPIEMWNNFDLVAYGIPTTTNSVEAWHRAFSTTVASHHPTFWKFCDALKIEQSSVELRQAQYYSGKPPTKSRTSLEKEFTMVSLVMNYYTRPIFTYLKSIAFKVSL